MNLNIVMKLFCVVINVSKHCIYPKQTYSREGEVERVHPENRSLIEQSVAQREKDYAVAR